VLRILVGLSREVCAWLLHTDVEQISQRTQSAVNDLAQVHSSPSASNLRSRVAHQMKLSALRNDGERVLR
jgi:hypothetical protein